MNGQLPDTWTIVGLGALIVSNVGLWIDKIYLGKKGINSNGRRERPGFTETCIEHETKLAVVESEQRRYNLDVSGIHSKIDQIFILLGGKADRG